MTEPDFAALRRRLAARAPASPGEGGTYIYGAGALGRRIASELRRLGRPVRGFLDRRAQALGEVDGLPCRLPGDLRRSEIDGADCVCAVMSATLPSAGDTVRLAGLGFRALLFPADLLELPGFDLDNYWLERPARVLAELDSFEALHDRLAAAEDRALLRALVAYRVSTDPRDHPPVSTEDAYRPHWLPIRGRPLTLADGGAFTGDTLEALLASGATIAEWLAFEPDPANMAALRRTAAARLSEIGDARLFDSALSDRVGSARFRAGDGLVSRLVEDDGDTAATSRIALARLDDLLGPREHLYVKLDVEGSEAAALRGMAGHLARCPILAVSVYHRPGDLLEIPRLIESLYPRPNLRLAQHGHHGFDTVLYVSPG